MIKPNTSYVCCCVRKLTTETFLSAGIVTDWQVYTNNAGTLGMLILRDNSGTNYQVIGADFEIASKGFNSFSFIPDTGVANVLAGDILGVYIGTSKIDFEWTVPGSAIWCHGNKCISDVDTQLSVGQSISLSEGLESRIYSANVTVVDVAEPTVLALLGLGMAGLGFRRGKH